jgi:hypothetical protein
MDVKADPTLKLVSARKFDLIWVIIDRLTKLLHPNFHKDLKLAN